MKTLDEVIKAYEVCHASVLSCEGCPYDNGERYRDSDCYIADALFYLKEYREKHDDILRMEEALGYCEIMDNSPLSWDELKTMQGKPVWVEWTKTEESYWCFVGEWFDDDEMRIYHIGRDYADYIHKTIYTPDIVQAYRKERK